MKKETLEQEIKEIIISALDLEDITVDDIDTSAPLFNEGLGLDSIDALELGMALKKKYGVNFKSDKEENKELESSEEINKAIDEIKEIDNKLNILKDYYDNNITIYIANKLKRKKMTHNNPKLKDKIKHTFDLKSDKDIVIEDLCFIKFTKACQIDIYTPYQVNIYERDNLI